MEAIYKQCAIEGANVENIINLADSHIPMPIRYALKERVQRFLGAYKGLGGGFHGAEFNSYSQWAAGLNRLECCRVTSCRTIVRGRRLCCG
jgi:hypothetical protein